jgi:hypothetical protein
VGDEKFFYDVAYFMLTVIIPPRLRGLGICPGSALADGEFQRGRVLRMTSSIGDGSKISRNN